MEFAKVFHSLLALVFVLGLIAVVSIILRKYSSDRVFAKGKSKGKRIQVVDAVVVDPKRKLLLVRRDDKEHLLLLGAGNDLVVEGDIVPPDDLLEYIEASDDSEPTDT